jgi:putative transposase
MTDYVRGSSSYTRLEIHLAFKVKYCHRVFDIPDFRKRCEQIFREVGAKEQVVIEEMGFDGDHVHMSWLMKVYHRADLLSKAFKGTSGRKLLREFPAIKRQYFWGSGLWSGVIYCDSMGKDPDAMKTYVRNQGKKPKDQRTVAEYLAGSCHQSIAS